MRITRSSDWRDQLPFETPVPAEGVLPGDAARCATCGVHSDPLPRSELWAVKHQHPHNPAGTVVMYCAEHTPRPAPAPVAPLARPRRVAGAPRERREPQPRAAARPERVAAVCPNCFMEIPATGVCGMCGYEVAG